MNRKQLVSLWIGIVVAVGMLVYPPFVINLPSSRDVSGLHEFLGYHFIVTYEGTYIDRERIALQLLAVSLLTTGLVVSFAKRRD